MKLKFLLFLVTLILCLTSCENNSAGKRYIEDNSSKMPKIVMTDEKYDMYINTKITPLLKSVYNLSNLPIENDMVKDEIEKINNINKNIDKINTNLVNVNVTTNKYRDKLLLSKELDNLKNELTKYKEILLESDDKKKIQKQKDVIFYITNNIKQY